MALTLCTMVVVEASTRFVTFRHARFVAREWPNAAAPSARDPRPLPSAEASDGRDYGHGASSSEMHGVSQLVVWRYMDSWDW